MWVTSKLGSGIWWWSCCFILASSHHFVLISVCSWEPIQSKMNPCRQCPASNLKVISILSSESPVELQISTTGLERHYNVRDHHHHPQLYRHFQMSYHQVLYIFGNLSWPPTWIPTQMQKFCKFFCKPFLQTNNMDHYQRSYTQILYHFWNLSWPLTWIYNLGSISRSKTKV